MAYTPSWKVLLSNQDKTFTDCDELREAIRAFKWPSMLENMRSFLLAILVVCAPIAVSSADCTTDVVAIITSTATWTNNVLQGTGTYNTNDATGEGTNVCVRFKIS